MAITTSKTLLNAITATSTSEPEDVSMRSRFSIQISGLGVGAGTGTFGVYISNDAVRWEPYRRLVSNITAGTVVSSSVLEQDSTEHLFFTQGDVFKYIKVACTVATAGVYSAVLHAVD